MKKHNPFRLVEADPALKEEMILKYREYAGKGLSADVSDSLWAAYQEILAQKPQLADELYNVFVDISSEIIPNPTNTLDLSEYDDIYYRDEDSMWYGVKNDAPEELPDMYQSFEDIYWDSHKNAWVGARDEMTMIPNPNTAYVYDAGRNSWFNIFTGEVE